MPEVRAQVAGFGELTMLVDSGAEFSWIDESYAASVGLPRNPLGARLVDIAGVESEIAERTFIEELKLGGLVVTNFRPPLLRTIDPGVQGAIGLDILRVITTAIDGQGRRMILSTHTDVAAALEPYYAPGAIALAYDVDWSSGWPSVLVAVQGAAQRQAFVVDTGSGPMTVTAALARELRLDVSGTTQFDGLSHGNRTTTVYNVPEMVLESLTIRGDDAWEAGHNSLGWGALRNTVLVLPAKADRLLLLLDARAR